MEQALGSSRVPSPPEDGSAVVLMAENDGAKSFFVISNAVRNLLYEISRRFAPRNDREIARNDNQDT